MLNESNRTPLNIYFVPTDSSQRRTGTNCEIALPSAFWVQGGGLLQQGLGDARGLRETPLDYSQAIDWDIRVFSFPVLGSLQSSSIKIYVASGDGRRCNTSGFEAVSQKMRPTDAFEVLVPLC